MPNIFPRNSGAELYPGMVKYLGVAGVFTFDAGEVVILAPNFTALEEHLKSFRVDLKPDRSRCRISKIEEVRGVTIDEPALNGFALQNPS